MVSISDAIDIIHRRYPESRIIGAVSTLKFYAFRLLDRGLDPKSPLDLPAGMEMKAVNKASGTVSSINAMFDLPEACEAVDILPYLSGAEANMYARICNLPRW